MLNSWSSFDFLFVNANRKLGHDSVFLDYVGLWTQHFKFAFCYVSEFDGLQKLDTDGEFQSRGSTHVFRIWPGHGSRSHAVVVRHGFLDMVKGIFFKGRCFRVDLKGLDNSGAQCLVSVLCVHGSHDEWELSMADVGSLASSIPSKTAVYLVGDI